ncbi:MAG: patatin family protein [Acutalibacteraceae bacterium]
MSVSLVLEGGGTRGAYTSGVLDVLMDNNLFIRRTYAVSAGACNALSYLSKQRGRNFQIFYNYVRDKRYMGYSSFRKTGSMFGFDFIFGELSHELLPFDYKEFFKTQMELCVGTTDCQTGQAVYFENSDFDERFIPVIASSSLPMVSPIVDFNNRQLLDGAMAAPIPIEKAIADGYTHNIIVLTQDREFIKPNKPQLPSWIMHTKFKQYPQLIEVMRKRGEVYNRERQFCFELEKQGKAIIIAPSAPITLKRYERDTEKLKEVYDMGVADTKKILQKIQCFIALND